MWTYGAEMCVNVCLEGLEKFVDGLKWAGKCTLVYDLHWG